MFRRLWGKIVAFFFGGVLGTIFGIALGFFFFPYVFPPPPATEQLTAADLAPPMAERPTSPESAQSTPSAAAIRPAPPSAVAPPAETSAPPAVASAPAAPATAAQPEQSAAAPPAAASAPAAPSAQSTQASVARPAATGTFIHANPSDPVHWGKGKVSVYQRAVFLEPDFEVGPGPAYHVYLVPKRAIRSSSDMKNVMYLDLGRLRSFKGSQRYPIPEGVNLKDYPSVIIWCERFSVLISPADLSVAQAAN